MITRKFNKYEYLNISKLRSSKIPDDPNYSFNTDKQQLLDSKKESQILDNLDKDDLSKFNGFNYNYFNHFSVLPQNEQIFFEQMVNFQSNYLKSCTFLENKAQLDNFEKMRNYNKEEDEMIKKNISKLDYLLSTLSSQLVVAAFNSNSSLFEEVFNTIMENLLYQLSCNNFKLENRNYDILNKINSQLVTIFKLLTLNSKLTKSIQVNFIKLLEYIKCGELLSLIIASLREEESDFII